MIDALSILFSSHSGRYVVRGDDSLVKTLRDRVSPRQQNRQSKAIEVEKLFSVETRGGISRGDLRGLSCLQTYQAADNKVYQGCW